MTIKKEYGILLLVIVALSLYLVLGRGEHPDSDLPAMVTLDSQNINRMVVTQQEASLEMVKKDTQWYLLPKQYPVDSIKIKNMLKAAAELTPTALVSESSNYERYGLGNSLHIKVQVYNDSTLARQFVVGKAAPTNQHTFVLIENDPNVYHAKGSLTSTFKQTTDELRDRTALSFERRDILSVRIEKDGQVETFTKTEATGEPNEEEKSAPVTQTQWQTSNGEIAKEATIKALLGSVANLKCDAYMADDAKSGLTDPTWTLTFKNDSETYTLAMFLGNKTETEQIPGISSANSYAFLLSKNKVESIEKQMEKVLAGPSDAK